MHHLPVCGAATVSKQPVMGKFSMCNVCSVEEMSMFLIYQAAICIIILQDISFNFIFFPPVMDVSIQSQQKFKP